MFVMISAAGQRQTAKITGVVSDQNGAAIANATVEFDAKGKCNLEEYLWHPDQKKIKRKEIARARTALFHRKPN